ncbi:DNA methyltransferase, partial [Mariniblastus sp.]|nr:DNA methyltransferase [Mariniblastus sp.]
MAATLAKFLGKIHQGDCVAGLKKVPSESVDLAFADPPFNIGFKYDQYDDQLGDDQYLAWSREWMAELHRVLKSEGAFWLAIGDEYAAELKIEAQNLGFHCRSWVIWYYTFGVNCKKKFTRSHAHIFHFVKDEKNFLFNHDDMDLRVPSAPGWANKINIVWILPGDCRIAPLAPELNKPAKRNFKLSFETPPAKQSQGLINGFERIVHQLRGVRIGLALGGGAARGMAHLGILKALEENGIVVDMIAGTSVGAMTGVLYCSGMEPDDNVQRFIEDLTPPWIFRMLPNGGYWYLLWKYRRGHFDPMLRKYLKHSQLEQLTIPVQSVTVDLVSGQPIIRKQGDAVHAITESINLPVLSRPINRNG